MNRCFSKLRGALTDPATVPGVIALGVISGLIVLGVDITLHETVLAPPRTIVEAPRTVVPAPDEHAAQGGPDVVGPPNCGTA
ncbi:hypothetical protein GCM10010495_73930 [Kitasatospora herbaricolor]|uniref:hypothetical protein n=1 Tax=Kitasatospora herbaricolor TaxID=68217 RepID=UPI00174DB91C|nr:hypothetical protein [Kitasatospora herbaricolor]MDQ0305447.1 hypothetical protein [Kitasatospora herbaricolor]GGV45597.1 hypothetical protein GCM10010495_73930 [Kitasatospora herbaricolor]